MAVLDQIQPKEVFRFFEEMSAIPRGTFNTKAISDYCVAFAKERNLEYIQDLANNVIIKKPGTAGYEDSEPVIIQGHLDMVCEKRPDCEHDFMKDGLKLIVENGLISAEGTTLGGDDGIAVSMALAVLDSSDIPHPPVEAVFTVDEEEGMGGANAIDLSVLKGKKLINIDSEVEGILTTGCASGSRYETYIPVTREKKSGTVVTLKVHGLQGGHSGAEIHKQRGNAHKMMGRLLDNILADVPFGLISVEGGSKDNVIAMECTAEILVTEADAAAVQAKAEEMKKIWDNEFLGDEPDLALDVTVGDAKEADVCDAESTDRVIAYLVVIPNGLQSYHRKLEGLTETSLNIGILETSEDCVKAVSLIRSSIGTRKQEIKDQMLRCAKLVKASVKVLNEYPAWEYDPDSALRKVMEEAYTDMFGKAPEVSAVHVGLECGLFLGKRPDLDCVSFGPNQNDIHSFNETLDIASTERMWNYLKEVLKRLK